MQNRSCRLSLLTSLAAVALVAVAVLVPKGRPSLVNAPISLPAPVGAPW